jgi:hypothetical protein
MYEQDTANRRKIDSSAPETDAEQHGCTFRQLQGAAVGRLVAD